MTTVALVLAVLFTACAVAVAAVRLSEGDNRPGLCATDAAWTDAGVVACNPKGPGPVIAAG